MERAIQQRYDQYNKILFILTKIKLYQTQNIHVQFAIILIIKKIVLLLL